MIPNARSSLVRILKRLAKVDTTLRTLSTRRRAQLVEKLNGGPSLGDFLAMQQTSTSDDTPRRGPQVTDTHYLSDELIDGQKRKGVQFDCILTEGVPLLVRALLYIAVYYEVYGCQMNTNDTDVVRAIMNAHNYTETATADDSDVHLIMTCSIREKAEDRIWRRIDELRKRRLLRARSQRPLTVGILGTIY